MTLIPALDLKFNPLEGAVADVVPAQWDRSHAAKRIVEGFETLAHLPRAMPVLTARGYWPTYTYTWEDLLAQQEQEDAEKSRTRQAQNRSRAAPSIEQITNMERALYWPVHYLFYQPNRMRAVNYVSFAFAIDRDIAWLCKRHGGVADTWRQRYDMGCEHISQQLIQDRKAVF